MKKSELKKTMKESINIDWVSEENPSELLRAHALIWNRMFNVINSMSLRSAVQLGIPDAIHNHEKPIPLSKLIDVLGIHQTKTSFVHRLMRILVHTGFFTLKEEGYVLTYASKLLLKDHPYSLAPFVLGALDPIMIQPFECLTPWLKNDEPTPFHTAHGMAFYEKMSHDAELSHLFNDAMAGDTRLVANVMLKKCHKEIFESVETFVDVGGGTGAVAKLIAAAYPLIQCTCFDLPHVVADLEGTKNLKFVGGNMFDAVPHADVILLKSIFHNWSDEESVKILEKCREGISSKNNGRNGKVIIIDIVIMKNQFGDDESTETQLFFDMEMMMHHTGKQRDEKEWAKLISDAGFGSHKINPVLGLRSLIEVYP